MSYRLRKQTPVYSPSSWLMHNVIITPSPCNNDGISICRKIGTFRQQARTRKYYNINIYNGIRNNNAGNRWRENAVVVYFLSSTSFQGTAVIIIIMSFRTTDSSTQTVTVGKKLFNVMFLGIRKRDEKSHNKYPRGLVCPPYNAHSTLLESTNRYGFPRFLVDPYTFEVAPPR